MSDAIAIDLEMYRGNTKAFNLSFARGGTPINLTGATITFSLKELLSDLTYVLQKTLAGGGIVSAAPTTGQAQLQFGPNDTKALYAPKNFVYDVELVEANGTTTTFFTGVFSLLADVTTS